MWKTIPRNFTSEEVDHEIEELSKSRIMERELGKRGGKWRWFCTKLKEENKSVVMVGGYNRDKPPQDDCCPICFDDFRFPCRTSCGHWFCSSCILMFWRYSANFKPCKCPVCGRLITNLVPESSVPIQQGEEVGNILKNIQQYNHLNSGGWFARFMKVVAQPLLIRRRLREHPNPIILDCIFNSLHVIGLLMGVLYKVYNFNFFPYGGVGIALFFDMCGHALVMFLVLDIMWHRWIRRRRVRQAGLYH